MMRGEGVVREIIRPSSPTPPHLRSMQLSFLDQLTPPFYIHVILYFESATKSPELKRSLADALAVYYPLAGRLRENDWVDCNDEGVEYVEARFDDVRISDVVENPRPEELVKYVAVAPSGGSGVLMAVQVNFFGCGGSAVGVSVLHRVADAASMVAFVNAWAASCRGDLERVEWTRPTFDVSSRFKPVDFTEFFKSVQVGNSPPPPPPEKIVTRIFKFDGEKVAALKKAISGPLMKDPTRVEAVSAFIWKHYIDSAAAKNPNHGDNVVFAATHVVDIRKRASPTLPDLYFGNSCARVMSTTTAAEQNYYDLAVKLREAIKKADADYVRRLEDGGTFLKYYSANEENDPAYKEGGKVLDLCGFTSWCRLPAYGADFGVGKPVWVSILAVPVKNLITFLATKCGDGIEAWVNMVEEDIVIIETNYLLIDKVI